MLARMPRSSTSALGLVSPLQAGTQCADAYDALCGRAQDCTASVSQAAVLPYEAGPVCVWVVACTNRVRATGSLWYTPCC